MCNVCNSNVSTACGGNICVTAQTANTCGCTGCMNFWQGNRQSICRDCCGNIHVQTNNGCGRGCCGNGVAAQTDNGCVANYYGCGGRQINNARCSYASGATYTQTCGYNGGGYCGGNSCFGSCRSCPTYPWTIEDATE